MAISADNNEIGIVAFRISQDDVGDWVAMRLHLFDDHLGSVTGQIMSHVRARLLAVTGILLRIDYEDGNGQRADEKRKRICYSAPRLAAGIPSDNNMLGSGPRPGLRQKEKWHAGGDKKRFSRPVARQSTGSRTTDDHQIGMQGIQRNAVIDVTLTEEAELEADVFTSTACRETSVRSVHRSCFTCLVAVNDEPNSLLPSNKRFRGTTIPNRWHRENSDEVSSMTECHPNRIGGARLAGGRGVDKDSYAFEWH